MEAGDGVCEAGAVTKRNRRQKGAEPRWEVQSVGLIPSQWISFNLSWGVVSPLNKNRIEQVERLVNLYGPGKLLRCQ